MLAAVAAGATPPAPALAGLQTELARAMVPVRLVPDGDGFRQEWLDPRDDLGWMLGPVARSAADLLVSPDLGHLKECPGSPGRTCGFLFVDQEAQPPLVQRRHLRQPDQAAPAPRPLGVGFRLIGATRQGATISWIRASTGRRAPTWGWDVSQGTVRRLDDTDREQRTRHRGWLLRRPTFGGLAVALVFWWWSL